MYNTSIYGTLCESQSHFQSHPEIFIEKQERTSHFAQEIEERTR